MTAYILLAFLWHQSGGITAEAAPKMFLGADQCQSQMPALKAYYAQQGFKPDQVVLVCVDSKLYPGIPA